MINALSVYLKTIFFGAHLFELIVIKRIKATKMPDRFPTKITISFKIDHKNPAFPFVELSAQF